MILSTSKLASRNSRRKLHFKSLKSSRNNLTHALAGYLGAAKAARGSDFSTEKYATPQGHALGYFWRFLISSTNLSNGTASCNPFVRSRTMMLSS